LLLYKSVSGGNNAALLVRFLLLQIHGKSHGNRVTHLKLLDVIADSPPEVDRNDQWLGVAVASQATDRGLALVRHLSC